MLNLSVVQMYPNVMSIEHGKVLGLRQKVQELQARLDWCQCNIDIFERGGNCSTHFWDLLGSLRGTDDVCFAVNLLCFYFYHSFVCFCSRKRPWDMRPLGRARAPQWWQLAPAALSVAWGDCWPVRETPRRGGLSIVIGANMVTMTSPLHLWAEFGRFVCLCLFLTGPISPHSRSRCGPESSRATTALGRGQLRQSRFEQTRTCLRTFAMSCY